MDTGTFLLILYWGSPVFWGFLCALYVNWAIRMGANHWVMLGAAALGLAIALGLSVAGPLAFAVTISSSMLVYDFVVEIMVVLIFAVLMNPHKV